MTVHLLACKLCAYSKGMPVWALFAILRVLVLGLVVGRKLDVVRIALLFSAVELICYWLAALAILHGGPVSDSAWPSIAKVLLLIYASGLPASMLLKACSRLTYFRPRLPFLGWRECFVIVPAWILLFAAQIIWLNHR